MKKRKKLIIGGALLVIIVIPVAWLVAVSGNTPKVVHVVKPGDTVAGISRSHDVRIKDIMKENPQLHSYRLLVGQNIVVPRPRLIVAVGRNMDKLAIKCGFDNPPFTKLAYKLTDDDSN